jgi:hypothetical protein
MSEYEEIPEDVRDFKATTDSKKIDSTKRKDGTA